MWNKPTWPDEHKELLQREWPHKSAGEIAPLVGRTRDAVVGQAHRMGLPSKRPARPRKAIPKKLPEPPMQQPKYYEGPDEGEGDRAMWAAVIAVALQDATGNPVLAGGSSRRQKSATIKEAQDWFTEAGSDFREVCELAGADWRKVREMAVGKFRA